MSEDNRSAKIKQQFRQQTKSYMAKKHPDIKIRPESVQALSLIMGEFAKLLVETAAVDCEQNNVGKITMTMQSSNILSAIKILGFNQYYKATEEENRIVTQNIQKIKDLKTEVRSTKFTHEELLKKQNELHKAAVHDWLQSNKTEK